VAFPFVALAWPGSPGGNERPAGGPDWSQR